MRQPCRRRAPLLLATLAAAAIIAALWAGEPTIVSSVLGALLVLAGLALVAIEWAR
jgi:drug/metabolite transporter (DMT)-like permease